MFSLLPECQCSPKAWLAAGTDAASAGLKMTKRCSYKEDEPSISNPHLDNQQQKIKMATSGQETDCNQVGNSCISADLQRLQEQN